MLFKISHEKTKKYILPCLVLLSFVLSAAGAYYLLQPRDEVSASLAGFDPGNIMSDFVMSNKGSMTESEIQSFLKSKNSCNDTNLSKKNGYEHHGYTIKDGHFVCMADEDFDGESAAHIIWQAGQDYNINPQVLIVLLQKEQGLVTDTWPNHDQYKKATGFACPDTGAGCDSKDAGFKTQIRKAAALFREVLDGGWSNYPVNTTQAIYYSPNYSCGTASVYIQNKATSALYRYTPYVPNQAALNAGYGTGDGCSSYGNRNFYNYFTDWFGSTNGYSVSGYIKQRQEALNATTDRKIGKAVDFAICANENECFQQFENGYILWKNTAGAWESKGLIRERYAKLNYEHGKLGYPVGGEFYSDRDGIGQPYENGYILGRGSTGYWESTGLIRERYAKLNYEHGEMGYPTGPVICDNNDNCSQDYEHGIISSYSDGTTSYTKR